MGKRDLGHRQGSGRGDRGLQPSAGKPNAIVRELKKEEPKRR